MKPPLHKACGNPHWSTQRCRRIEEVGDSGEPVDVNGFTESTVARILAADTAPPEATFENPKALMKWLNAKTVSPDEGRPATVAVGETLAVSRKAGAEKPMLTAGKDRRSSNPVAQRKARRPPKAKVAGSTPAGVAKLPPDIQAIIAKDLKRKSDDAAYMRRYRARLRRPRSDGRE